MEGRFIIMKKQIICALCVLTLCGCAESDAKIEETDIITETQSVHTEDTLTESTEVSAAETTVSETVEETSAAEPDEPIIIDSGIDLNDFAEEGSTPFNVIPCGGDNICVHYRYSDGRSDYVRVVDIAERKTVETADMITVPEDGWYLWLTANDGGGKISAYAEFGKYIENEDGTYDEKTALAEIYRSGGAFTLNMDMDYTDEHYICGERTVAHSAGGITDTSTNEYILERYEREDDPNGFYTRTYWYMFPVDENRFVYRVSGYESMPAFGVYDFETGTANEVPDSRDMMPMGMINGKIYSHEAYWDGYGRKIYVTDPDTLETELLCDSPFETDINDYLTYDIPENGEYIGVFKLSSSNDHRFALLDPENGEIIREYVLPQADMYCDGVFFTDNYICFRNFATGIMLVTER